MLTYVCAVLNQSIKTAKVAKRNFVNFRMCKQHPLTGSILFANLILCKLIQTDKILEIIFKI